MCVHWQAVWLKTDEGGLSLRDKVRGGRGKEGPVGSCQWPLVGLGFFIFRVMGSHGGGLSREGGWSDEYLKSSLPLLCTSRGARIETRGPPAVAHQVPRFHVPRAEAPAQWAMGAGRSGLVS